MSGPVGLALRALTGMALAFSLLSAGCGPQFMPVFDPLDQEEYQAVVGDFLTIELAAQSNGGHTLAYEYRAVREDTQESFDFQKWADERERPQIMSTKADGSAAVFVWQPRYYHVGAWLFTFRVTEAGGPPSDQTVRIVVRESKDSFGEFIEPSNQGITIDVKAQPCIEMKVLFTSRTIPRGIRLGVSLMADNLGVEQRKQPLLDGMFEGTFKWCPTPEQVPRDTTLAMQFTATTTTSAKDYAEPNKLVGLKDFRIRFLNAPPMPPAPMPAASTK